MKDYTFLKSSEAQTRFGLDTGAYERPLSGVFVAHTRKAVSLVLEKANTEGFKLWPISGGMNFGYGTSLPVGKDHYIFDLSQLKDIVFNQDSHSVTIEPGVTQQDLADFLDKHKLPYLVPTTGLGPNGSLLGNALDGGYGLTPQTDHFKALSEIEGVLGNGTSFRHSYRDLNCIAMAQSWAAQTGPTFTSLLRQGNYAIVTKATLRLARTPEATRVLIIEWSTEEDFLDGQEALSTIMEDIPGTGGIISMNASRILSTQLDTPLATNVTGQLRLDYLDNLAKKRKISAWTSVGTLYGGKHLIKGAVKDIKRRLPKATVFAFSVPAIRGLSKVMGYIPKQLFSAYHRHVDTLQETIGTVEGRPIVVFLKIAYALDDTNMVMTRERNPARDGQGILWFAPLVNISRAAVNDYLQSMRKVLHQFGFDNLLAVTTRSSRVHSGTIPLIFRKNDPASVQRAKSCYRALVRMGLLKNMPVYRIGVEYMDEMYPPSHCGFSKTLRDIQGILDPNNVIAPGRYTPESSTLDSFEDGPANEISLISHNQESVK